jgi:Amidohydrolase family
MAGAVVIAFVLLGITLSYVVRAGRAGDGGNYDVVIANGRVMDPESGLDGVRNVAISGGKIRAISADSLQGKTTIDAKGLVVAPGFIDLHEHGQEPKNYQFQAHDGVTTSLELEAGTADVAGWYAKREGKSLINFGVSIGHIPVRMKELHDTSGGLLATGDAAHREATPAELSAMKADMEAGRGHGCELHTRRHASGNCGDVSHRGEVRCVGPRALAIRGLERANDGSRGT